MGTTRLAKISVTQLNRFELILPQPPQYTCFIVKHGRLVSELSLYYSLAAWCSARGSTLVGYLQGPGLLTKRCQEVSNVAVRPM